MATAAPVTSCDGLSDVDCAKVRVAEAGVTDGPAQMRTPPLYIGEAADVVFQIGASARSLTPVGEGMSASRVATVRVGEWVRAELLPSSDYEILKAPEAVQRRDADGQQSWAWTIKPLHDPRITLRVKLEVVANLGGGRFQPLQGNTREAAVAVAVRRADWWERFFGDSSRVAKSATGAFGDWKTALIALFALLGVAFGGWRWLRSGAKDAPPA